MNTEIIAARLAELGHTTRLTVYRELIKAGNTGVAVGEIQKRLDIPGSTLSHHLSRLIKVGLVRQQRDSRTLYCIAETQALGEVILFLTEECCIDDDSCSTC